MSKHTALSGFRKTIHFSALLVCSAFLLSRTHSHEKSDSRVTFGSSAGGPEMVPLYSRSHVMP